MTTITRKKRLAKSFDIALKKNSVNEKGYTAEFILSTNDVDRHGDSIEQTSWKFENFMKNPVLLLQHNSNAFPIGIWEEIWTEKDGGRDMLVGRARFAVDEYSEAKTAFNLVKGGFMRTISVGFLWGKATYEEEREITILSDCELLEASLVSIPANPYALLKSEDDEVVIATIENTIETLTEEIEEEKEFKVNKKLKARHYLMKALRNLK